MSQYDNLLKELPNIAKVVAEFPDSVQEKAFDTLILEGRAKKYYPGFKECCRIRSGRSGIRPV